MGSEPIPHRASGQPIGYHNARLRRIPFASSSASGLFLEPPLVRAALTDPSPNFGERRDCARPWLVVLHYTAMESALSALERLCDPDAEVSSHYLIAEDGHVHSLVAEEMRAWHAGVGSWAGCDDVNSASIGIELDNDGASPFAEPQMLALEVLLREVIERWDIRPENVIGHSDCAPDRKVDPGPHFNWARLARKGLALDRSAPSTV